MLHMLPSESRTAHSPIGLGWYGTVGLNQLLPTRSSARTFTENGTVSERECMFLNIEDLLFFF